MLHINDLTYRIEGRVLLDGATTALPAGHKVGLVGRNGSGKTTLLRLINGEIPFDDGAIGKPKNASMSLVSQQVPSGPNSLLDQVLSADHERTALLQEAESAQDPHRIAEIQIRLSDIDAHSAPARAATILSGLGFDEAAQARACSEYSGGWRMRVALASALFAEPDILLLDEPNNYLDLEGALWLENFLRAYRHTVLLVSHDRDLLNSAVTSILHLDKGKLTLYSGGYDQFEETRREQQRLELKLKKKQDDARRHMEAFVERFRAKATKARQAQSRLKALEKMQPIAAQIDERVAPFIFPNPKKSLGNPLMRLENCSVGYEPGKPILSEMDLRIDIDDRIGLLGTNGNGKSTFAKLLSSRLEPFSGHFRHSKKIQIGYFSQHQIDELNPKQSPYDHISALMEDATEAQKRAKLGHIGFGIEKADTKCAHLSGGEKARLLFALAAFHGPHLLILDEPTNHLDVDSCEALIHAINDYEGAIILISHDRHLVNACADRLWIAQNNTVKPYEGDLETYRAECLRQKKTESKQTPDSETPNHDTPLTPLNKQQMRKDAAQARARLAPLKKAATQAEREFEKIQKDMEKIDLTLSDNKLYEQDKEKMAELAKQRGQLARSLEEAEEAWMSALEDYENARLNT